MIPGAGSILIRVQPGSEYTTTLPLVSIAASTLPSDDSASCESEAIAAIFSSAFVALSKAKASPDWVVNTARAVLPAMLVMAP